MYNIKKYCGLLLYYGFTKYLPASQCPIVGKLAKKMRAVTVHMIIKNCGKNINVDKGAIFSPRISIGDNSGIGKYSEINGRVWIGDNVMMGPECMTFTKNHEFSEPFVLIREQGYQRERPIIIGDDVWIGARVTILPGVKIGNGAIIGAGAVVTKDIPENTIYAGNPARQIGIRNGKMRCEE